jgi:hypothetical protein
LLHAFELTNPTDDDLIQLGKQVVELQKKRRQTKNFIEITEPLFNYVTNNRHVTKQLGKVHGEMLGIIKVQSNRKYTPKEKTSLQEAFDKAQNLATV